MSRAPSRPSRSPDFALSSSVSRSAPIGSLLTSAVALDGSANGTACGVSAGVAFSTPSATEAELGSCVG